MLNLPTYLSILFIATTLLTLILVIKMIRNAHPKSKNYLVIFGLLFWLALHGILAYVGFYKANLDQMPPRLMLFGAIPGFALMFYTFLSDRGKKFIDPLSFFDLTLLSIVRIPVEICLYYLALHKAVPELMSFAGRNFDILAGIAVPFVIYFGMNSNSINKTLLWVWNIIGTLLLLNIIVHAILSAPFPLQQFAFDQPNLAILNFPFIWLAVFVAPVVLFSHFISIRKLVS